MDRESETILAMMEQMLREAVAKQASDLHVTVGIPPVLRIHGSLVRMDLPALSFADTESLFAAIADDAQRKRFETVGEVDFSYAIRGLSRFRVNAFRQRGSIAVAVRVINEQIPTLDSLGLPEIVKFFARKPRGLVMVTGPTGSGKSTTLAAMINLINEERSCHIITLEDPIEYLHRHKKCIIKQIGRAHV